MPRSGRVPRGEVIFEDGWSEARDTSWDNRETHYTPPDDWVWDARAGTTLDGLGGNDGRPPASGAGVQGRRTVTITGQGAEGYYTRNGTRPSSAARHRQLKRHERTGFRPDRVAMWAVLLGVMLMLAAVTSSHAAVLAPHHLTALASFRPR